MSTTDLEEHVWRSLAAHPIRRAMLGRERCDAIVATAVEEQPTGSESLFAGHDSAALRERWEQRVRIANNDRCGFAFTTMIVLWAISAIVQILVKKWWENHRL
jgi:hypothetical protein